MTLLGTVGSLLTAYAMHAIIEDYIAPSVALMIFVVVPLSERATKMITRMSFAEVMGFD